MRPNRSAARPSPITSAICASPVCASAARPASASSTPPNAADIRTSGLSPSPFSARITSATSSALPSDAASGWFMSVTTAEVRQPAALAVPTSACANARASSPVFMKAPLPAFTSSTSASGDAASFLDRIEAVIRSRLSTVAVTSRIA